MKKSLFHNNPLCQEGALFYKAHMLFFLMKTTMNPILQLKTRLLCEGLNPDRDVEELFLAQNPSRALRGGLSSGGKFCLQNGVFVNAPFYRQRFVPLKAVLDPSREQGFWIVDENTGVTYEAAALVPPAWYQQTVAGFPITKIITAHNRQLAAAIYENCALFAIGSQCRFCVMNHSLEDKEPALVLKKPELLLAALAKIPLAEYGGLTLNGGMTLNSGRGMELLFIAVEAIKQRYPDLPIAVESAPPKNLSWIDCLAAAGANGLMMNLECWDEDIRATLIPGKSHFCSRDQYMRAFERALTKIGEGKVSTCFVVGSERKASLLQGIKAVVEMGVIPSPLAGRFFEDIPDYPFVPQLDWQDFLEVIQVTAQLMRQHKLLSADKAGCVACGMCDLIKNLMP